MKEDRVAYLLVLTVILAGIPASLAPVSATSLMAQQPGPRRNDRRETPGEKLRRERQERQMADMELRSVEKLGRTPPEKKPPERILYQQISEDYQRLQEVNNEMMRNVFRPGQPDNAVDFKLVIKSLEEINKRASRLKTNLRLPTGEDKQADTTHTISSIIELKASLQKLDELIMGFIENPTFERPGVVDVEHSAKARRDLEGIVAHSQSLRDQAKRLQKN